MAGLILSLALTLAVLEGAIRKWVIGSEASPWSYVAYFSKDILFASLLLFPRRPNTAPALELFRRALLIGGGLIAFGGAIACCRDFNLVGAALTFRATIALPLIAYAAVARLAGLRLLWVAALLAALTCVNCGLGIAQNHQPVDNVLNRYVASEAEVAALESGVRATGTFSYITGLALLSSVGIWAGFVILTCRDTPGWKAAAAATILAGIGCGLASVSRGPIIVGSLLLAGWACFTRFGRSSFLKIGEITVFVLLAGLALGLVTDVGQMATAVLERHEQSEDSLQQRVLGQFSQSATAASIAPLGQGPGTEQVAANYTATGTMKFTTFEDQMPRLILETGVLGALGFIITCSGALVSLQMAKQSTTDPRFHAVLVVTQMLLGFLFCTNVVFNHTASSFAWMIFAAVMAAVPPATRQLARAPHPTFKNHFRRASLAH